jgi:DNA primase catalytic subunit
VVHVRYELPDDLRPSTLVERREFYGREMDYDAAERWFHSYPGERIFALILGRHSGIYPRRFRTLKNISLLVEDARTVRDLRPYLLKYLPEGVYYDRNAYLSVDGARRAHVDYAHAWRSRWFRGQELAFDLDPENLDCPVHGDIREKMRRHQGLSFCDWEFEETRRQAGELHDLLAREWSKLSVVYSGRGFHVHVLDADAYGLSRTQRSSLARRYGKHFALDEWVTSGEMRLIRLPHSLHGMVSRLVVPVARSSLEAFGYNDSRTMPRFVRG